MNQTPTSERVHIGFFGRRNAGKSSVMNAVTGQNLAVVSQVKGTTTDPVYKSMELLPLGPVTLMDTPGIDDTGELGALRVKKSYQALNKTDTAVVVLDGDLGATPEDLALISKIREKKIPWLAVVNKQDQLTPARQQEIETDLVGDGIPKEQILWVSATEKTGIFELKERLAHLAKPEENQQPLVSDLVSPEDFVVLVVPIDKAAPKGRLILPQQQVIRDLLDTGAIPVVCRDTELESTLTRLGQTPRLVITDSQAFEKVSRITPESIPLTSFSILFARYKGTLEPSVKGAAALDTLEDGDTVLICEGCTHHRQCDDIGSVKLPRWIGEYTKKELNFAFTSGTEFPDELEQYKMIVHCGGCMLNAREMKYRMSCALDQGVPMTNYGILIAQLKGILKRSVALFPRIAVLLP
ncbi:MAG TPA: [FeFe] hydrogenase H-cluster maturation GTPase HydF [Candidatus Egerieicola faecale]|uniref:[FeFe] hydrogenase H-cluster maturation GTPase HydF n=1 Tax=Candidatus Egerieicola faecale TaxID=2840774 RepID=A0A9D1IR79_9FIRM|nr:[FeFe] hydrogenase H-cluster maturation GTPase HydF [Candidatus Egerieicola faecale]